MLVVYPVSPQQNEVLHPIAKGVDPHPQFSPSTPPFHPFSPGGDENAWEHGWGVCSVCSVDGEIRHDSA